LNVQIADTLLDAPDSGERKAVDVADGWGCLVTASKGSGFCIRARNERYVGGSSSVVMRKWVGGKRGAEAELSKCEEEESDKDS